MRADLGLSPTSTARRATKSFKTASRCCATLSIAAPWAPIPLAGDGAGILVQIPHAFFKAEGERLGFRLPATGAYGVGQLFMPRDPELRARCEQIVAKVLSEEHIPLHRLARRAGE